MLEGHIVEYTRRREGPNSNCMRSLADEVRHADGHAFAN